VSILPKIEAGAKSRTKVSESALMPWSLTRVPCCHPPQFFLPIHVPILVNKEPSRHDVWDVSAGSILGFVVAMFGYRRYYPSPFSPNCHLPFPSPLEDTKAERRLPSARQDEEDARSQAESFDLNDLTEEEDEDESHERQPLTTGDGTQSRGKPKRGDSE
jgi:hypothetical protein